jgi:hypothetical protein
MLALYRHYMPDPRIIFSGLFSPLFNLNHMIPSCWHYIHCMRHHSIIFSNKINEIRQQRLYTPKTNKLGYNIWEGQIPAVPFFNFSVHIIKLYISINKDSKIVFIILCICKIIRHPNWRLMKGQTGQQGNQCHVFWMY